MSVCDDGLSAYSRLAVQAISFPLLGLAMSFAQLQKKRKEINFKSSDDVDADVLWRSVLQEMTGGEKW